MNKKFIFILCGFLISASYVYYLGNQMPRVNTDNINTNRINKDSIYQTIQAIYNTNNIPSLIEFPKGYKLNEQKIDEYKKLGVLKIGKSNPMTTIISETTTNDSNTTDNSNYSIPNTDTNVNPNINNTVINKKDLGLGDTPITPLEKGKYVISSKFGVRVVKDFYNGKPHLHRGIDLSCPQGTEVVSPLDGEVVEAFTQKEGGNILVIKHSEDVTTLYAHLKEFKVKKGDKVKKGQVIALSGNTGLYTTGPHLHFELHFNNIPINPEEYIDFR